MRSTRLVTLVAALSGLLLCLPALARANGLRISSYEMNDLGGTIQLESNATIGEPWIRLEAHAIKVWFPDIVDIARFDHARDGKEAIRAVQLRPGAADSAVLRVDLGTGRPISQDAVVVTLNGTTASVKVRLPAPQPTPAAPAPVAAVKTAPPLAQATAAPVPARATQAKLAPQPAAAVALEAAAPVTEVDEPAPKPLQLAAAAAPGDSAPASTNSAGKQADKTLNLAPSSAGNLGILIAISVLLAGVYGGLKYYGKYHAKKRAGLPPDIEVVSSRRLGHRQELMVVRALGADHLLMCSPGKVERVTSVPSAARPTQAPSPAATPEPSAAPAEAESQAGGLGVFSKLSSRSRLRRLLDAVDAEGAAQADAEELEAESHRTARASGRPSFGPELLSAIHSHKLTNLSALPPLAPAPGRESESVAGIARLRGRGAN